MRPREVALLLLSASRQAPRQRARDQQADRAGLDLKRRLLTRFIEFDPEPDAVETLLQSIVFELGAPTGPTRAVAAAVRDELAAVPRNPLLLEQLLNDAVQAGRSRPQSLNKSES